MGNEDRAPSGVVDVCELGELGVRSGGAWCPIRGERTRAAVAALALADDEGVSTERLIDAVWPPPTRPPTARQSLANLVARLRATHGDRFVETTRAGYRLGQHTASDRRRFIAAVARASQLVDGAPDEALDTIDQALAYVRGRPWHDVDSFIEVEADRAFLESEIARAERIRARALVALGRSADAIPLLERIVLADPVDESCWFALAVAQAGLGRRVDALRTLRWARRQLGEHGLTLGESAAELERHLLHGSTEPVHAPTQLPVTSTSLIGRDELLATITGSLSTDAVLTLLGPAGVGKTRLAVELLRRLPNEEWCFIDLSPVLDADRVVPSVVAALEVTVEPGTAPTDALLDHIGTGNTLLVLDNCEQVVHGVADLVDAIAIACPSCRIVVTTRERLGIRAERVVKVDPLPTGPAGPGVELFFDRAQRHGADLPPETWRESVARLCRSLDGLPLAIELAAARTTVLSPTEILQALSERFRVLRDPGGTALEDAIQWSWDLLDQTEVAALHQLGVFHSGATVDAASHVWQLDRWGTLDLAERLAGKSLVEIRRSPTAPTRFEMLDSIRYFALADAQRTETIERCRDRHLEWADELTLRAQGPHGFSGEPGGIDTIDRERHEVRAALDHATSRPDNAARGAMICHRLFGWWRARSAAGEGFERLEALLSTADLGPDDRAAATATLASLARIASVPDRDVRSLIALAQQLLLEVTASSARDHVELRLIEATFDDDDSGLGSRLRRLADADLDDECATALHLLSAWSITNEPVRAAAVADEFFAAVESSSEPADGHPREFQGLAALVVGDVTGAATHLAEALQLHIDNEKTFCAIHCAEGVAWLALETGASDSARSLLAATEGLRRSRRRSRAGFEEQAITGTLRHLGTLPEPELDADVDDTIAAAWSIIEGVRPPTKR